MQVQAMRASPRKFLICVMACGILMLANLLTVKRNRPRAGLLPVHIPPYRDKLFVDADKIDPYDQDDDLEELYNFDEDTMAIINDLEEEDDPLMQEDVPPEEYLEAGKDHYKNPNMNFEGEEDRFEVAEEEQEDSMPDIPKVHWVRPIPDADRDHWRAIRTGNDSVYVFSAFYDPIYEVVPIIRIISIARRDSKEQEVVCHLNYKFKAGSRTRRTMGVFKVIKGQNSKSKYVSKWIHCSLPEERMFDVPDRIRVIIPYFKDHYLQVHYKKQKKHEEIGINVCVSPLPNDPGNVTRMVEFIELQKLMGAMHFTFYKKYLTKTIMRLLINYKHEGFVTIFEHDLPEDLDVEDGGGPALAQDCFLRTRGVFQYALMVDVHEFVIPPAHETLRGMIREMDLQIASGIVFPAHIYCIEGENNRTIERFLHVMKRAFSIKSHGPFQLNTMLKTLRFGYCDLGQHSRTIVKPWNIDEVQKNNITSSKLGYARIEAPSFIGVVRHYKSCPDISLGHLGAACHGLPKLRIDLRLHNYLQKLSKRVLHRMQKINKAVIRKGNSE